MPSSLDRGFLHLSSRFRSVGHHPPDIFPDIQSPLIQECTPWGPSKKKVQLGAKRDQINPLNPRPLAKVMLLGAVHWGEHGQRITSRVLGVLHRISLLSVDEESYLAQVSGPLSSSPSLLTSTPRRSSNKDPSLCYVHNRYGRMAYRCASPRSCRMKDVIIKPPTSTQASGNTKAGRQ